MGSFKERPIHLHSEWRKWLCILKVNPFIYTIIRLQKISPILCEVLRTAVPQMFSVPMPHVLICLRRAGQQSRLRSVVGPPANSHSTPCGLALYKLFKTRHEYESVNVLASKWVKSHTLQRKSFSPIWPPMEKQLYIPEPRILVNFRWLISQKLLIKVL